MINEMPAEKIDALGRLIHEMPVPVRFTILEIGAAPQKGKPEIFHRLLDLFPGSRVIAFEVDEELCDKANEDAKAGLQYFPIALGDKEETRVFYETENPMCSSLYKPNEELLKLYKSMELAKIKSETSIDTISLDQFAREHDVADVDFIKIDIQGAELDVFMGGSDALRNVVAIVSEVEFIQHYIDQPLFGDVSEYLTGQGFMFHKFLGMSGRALKPVTLNKDPTYPSQHIWTDAVFIRDVQRLSELPPEKVLKLAVLSFLYGSTDVAFFCLKTYDEKHNTNYRRGLMELLA